MAGILQRYPSKPGGSRFDFQTTVLSMATLNISYARKCMSTLPAISRLRILKKVAEVWEVSCTQFSLIPHLAQPRPHNHHFLQTYDYHLRVDLGACASIGSWVNQSAFEDNQHFAQGRDT
jgi:hypothetical protein